MNRYFTTMTSSKTQRGAAALRETTDYVLHKSQQTIPAGLQKKILDYTEFRLIRYASTIKDAQQKLVLMALISDYREGHVAVAWRSGLPIYVKVTKNG